MSDSDWEKTRIDLHGWDASARAWHGPDELKFNLNGCRSILRKLSVLPGSWYGRMRAEVPGMPSLSFAACIHDLGDSALGVLDLEGSPGGPLQMVLVVPACRRAKLRPELAFEFVSFVRFLEGPEAPGNELAIHDYIQQVLEKHDDRTTLIFSIEARPLLAELQMPIAEQSERIAMCMIEWMCQREACSCGRGCLHVHARAEVRA